MSYFEQTLGYNGGELGEENLAALERGLPNLLRHVENIKEVYGLSLIHI